jgi:hypothetical protein
MTGRRVRGAAISALLAGAAILAPAGTAHAIPPAGPNESVTYTFYSDASRTVEVGWWSYGACGEPFDFGTHTAYFRIRTVTCRVE